MRDDSESGFAEAELPEGGTSEEAFLSGPEEESAETAAAFNHFSE